MTEGYMQDFYPRNIARQFFYTRKVAHIFLPIGKLPAESCPRTFTFIKLSLTLAFSGNFLAGKIPRATFCGQLSAGNFSVGKILRATFCKINFLRGPHSINHNQ